MKVALLVSLFKRFLVMSALSIPPAVQGDLVFTTEKGLCETIPQHFIASTQFTPSLDQVFRHVPQASSRFHVYSIAEVSQSVLNSVRMELAQLPDVQCMSKESLDDLTRPIAQYYSTISPATSAVFCHHTYLLRQQSSLTSIAISLLTFWISFTLFRRQWQRQFSHPHMFFRDIKGRFCTSSVTLLSGIVMMIHCSFISQ